MLESVAQFDKELFLFLNSLHHPLADPVMQLFTTRNFWIPLYIGLSGWLIYSYRKQAWLLMPILLTAVALADRISSGFFKPYFARLRPCHEPDLNGLVHFLDSCGGQYGFISSHAANTFALAMFLHILLKPEHKAIRIFFWSWAAVVTYSRIYVGVHYPADILLGTLLGLLIGYAMGKLFFYLQHRWFPASVAKFANRNIPPR